MKKKLVMWLNWLWDRIAAIPYFLKIKENHDNEIYVFDLENWYNYQINNEIMNIYKEYKLYDKLLLLPFNKFKLTKFLIHNLFHFDEVYIPVKSSRKMNILWRILWKKITYTFKDLNDNSKYDNIVDWLMWEKCGSLFDLLNNKINFPYDNNYVKKFWIKSPFAMVYVWPYMRSIFFNERVKIFNYLHEKGIIIILVWSSDKSREYWINNHLNSEMIEKYKIINLIWKTKFIEICSIIKDATICISANWWIMWLAHALNKNVVSFSTCSWLITHPPYNNKTSFHIRKEACKCPCEMNIAEEEYKKYWYKNCIYKWTNKEWLCKKLTWNDIIDLTNKILT